MSIFALFTLAVGLSMDAFAVAVCKGLAMKKITVGKAVIVGLWFGGFQGLMPLLGYFLGVQFEDKITSVDHWIAFVLLGLIGLNMIREALAKDEEECPSCNGEADLSVKSMFVLAVGVTFAFLKVNIWFAVACIGITTFCFSMAGVKVGNVFGTKYKSKAELAGGIILILLGTKILLEHLGVF